ncbi:hypothetical protein [Carnobacterium inhibens]|uniref:Uncharacterized protein n=2 Tax=Carnobacterium inhibens TaxID=147709 RepID=U5SCI4_9LACT|nr:hypothetical protein [Carnobacterium inhibens]AGY82955.1 hypothetical protein Q783_11820 [Carnobacterium inhibens subsp. gilichinskyi]MBC9826253.1 hypothetical protein [Carnobacterium inhibens]
MSTISKKLEQIEKLKRELSEEKEKIEHALGKEVINQFELDHASLTKNEIRDFVKNLKDFYELMNEDQTSGVSSTDSSSRG